MPRVIIFAGPNGAGKTTFAREYLPNEAGVVQFVNADLIAAGLSPFDPDSAAVVAGRIMLQRIEELAGQGVDFALETTLSGNWLVHHILKWRSLGYEVELYFLRLPNAEFAIQRVAKRVSEGGHNIPEAVIRRRFTRSQALLESKYKAMVDFWLVGSNAEVTPFWSDEGGGGMRRDEGIPSIKSQTALIAFIRAAKMVQAAEIAKQH